MLARAERSNAMLGVYEIFKIWCYQKWLCWKKEEQVVFKQGDIWWCKIGMNVGEEMFGKGPTFTRPVLVFRKFTGNSFLGLPLTKQEKEGNWYVEISMHGKKNWVMLNQARILDKKRFATKIGELDDKDFKKVKEQFLSFYGS